MIGPHHIILILLLPGRFLIRHLPINLRPGLTPRLSLALPVSRFSLAHAQWKMAIAIDEWSIDAVDNWLFAA